MNSGASDWNRETFVAESNVSRETLEKIDLIVAELDAWRHRLNLIGPKEWPEIWRRHIWDSAQILSSLDLSKDIVDLGSGSGFPGLVLSAAQSADARGQMTLVESSAKKSAFLCAAIASAELRCRVLTERIESMSNRPKADYVTARALAPLTTLLDYAAPWLEAGATGVFHKGMLWEEELTLAAEQWTFSHQAIPSRSGGSGVILVISEVCRVG